MSRDWTLYLEDMAESCRKVMTYTAGLDLEGFVANGLVYDAVIRNLEVLGEAAKNIPDQVRQRYPQVDWRKIAGLRDVLTHRYFGLEPETLWDTIQNKVPGLLEQLRQVRPDAR